MGNNLKVTQQPSSGLLLQETTREDFEAIFGQYRPTVEKTASLKPLSLEANIKPLKERVQDKPPNPPAPFNGSHKNLSDKGLLDSTTGFSREDSGFAESFGVLVSQDEEFVIRSSETSQAETEPVKPQPPRFPRIQRILDRIKNTIWGDPEQPKPPSMGSKAIAWIRSWF